jgi:hypothetical protein
MFTLWDQAIMSSRALYSGRIVLVTAICGMVALVAIGCNSKVDRIMQGAEDVDQHSQRI